MTRLCSSVMRLSAWRRLCSIPFILSTSPNGYSARHWCSFHTGGDNMACRKMLGLVLSVALVVGLWAAPATLAEEKPQKGGVLRVALAGDTHRLDMHQEYTFLVEIHMSTMKN